MKKLAFTILLTCLVPIVSWAVTDDQIIPVHVIDNNTSKERTHRSQGVPFEAFYDESTSSVRVYFLQNVGEVDIYLTSYTTGSCLEITLNSSMGVTTLPIMGIAGFYTIEFYTPDNQGYIGEFFL